MAARDRSRSPVHEHGLNPTARSRTLDTVSLVVGIATKHAEDLSEKNPGDPEMNQELTYTFI